MEQLADRADLKQDMIIRGGETISPREIEEFLLRFRELGVKLLSERGVEPSSGRAGSTRRDSPRVGLLGLSP